MRSILVLLLVLGLSACADPDPPGGTTPPPTREDMAAADMSDAPDLATPDMPSPKDMSDEPDLAGPDMSADKGPDCACSETSECCDGCQVINVGGACDDGLECTLETTCQDDGACGASTGSPCDAQLEHPDCQVAMCDEVAGCSSAPAREGFDCDTPQAGTYEGKCESGVCVGQKQCECTEADGPCCDGCRFEPRGTECGVSENGGIACNIGECGGDWEQVRTRFFCNGAVASCPTEDGEQFAIDSGTCTADQSCQSASAMPCAPDPSCP